MSPFTWFLILYTGSALVAVVVLWFYYEKRDRRLFDARRKRKVFHCVRCSSLYSIRKRDVSEGEPCPECGYKNYELSF